MAHVTREYVFGIYTVFEIANDGETKPHGGYVVPSDLVTEGFREALVRMLWAKR